MSRASTLPVIDLEPLTRGGAGAARVAAEIGDACRSCGFFYAVGHGVAPALVPRLEALSRRFFAQDPEHKLAIRMELGGRAWRGYFPVGAEFTLGRPDHKEGLYFGSELAEDHPRVMAGTPLHGRNLFPDGLPGFREAVLAYLGAMTRLGHLVMEGIARSLGLEPSWFADRYLGDPTILFRVFNYPPLPSAAPGEPVWSVGEHTDYGVLTLLAQDGPGLEVRVDGDWIPAPPISGSFVCNLGDMLDHMTGGAYRSTPHRARNQSGRDRLSLPFFFDPSWDARVGPIDPSAKLGDDAGTRWDGVSVYGFEGRYGDYLLAKVSKVFPDLERDVL